MLSENKWEMFEHEMAPDQTWNFIFRNEFLLHVYVEKVTSLFYDYDFNILKGRFNVCIIITRLVNSTTGSIQNKKKLLFW